jgi:hypothetical protein
MEQQVKTTSTFRLPNKNENERQHLEENAFLLYLD